jgi:hypothetical protein
LPSTRETPDDLEQAIAETVPEVALVRPGSEFLALMVVVE